VLAELNERRSIASLRSSNKSIHFFIDFDAVLLNLGLESLFVDATVEVVFD